MGCFNNIVDLTDLSSKNNIRDKVLKPNLNVNLTKVYLSEARYAAVYLTYII